MTGNLTLAGARIAGADAAPHDGWVRISGDRIAEVGSGPPPAPVLDCTGRWVVPGFVDIHCHGGGGSSFTDAHPDVVVNTHLRHGTTTMLASLMSAPLASLVDQLDRLAPWTGQGVLAGIHLEGPFLSAARCGAHDPTVLRAPDPESVDRLLRAGQGRIKMVTLAPELDGSLSAVRQLAGAGVLVAIGHTDAGLPDVIAAVEAGASVATHLFNGMRPLHHREPGPVGALLDDDRVTVELICDLIHLHPVTARLAANFVGKQRTALVTDAISAADAGDGQYELGGQRVTVDGGAARTAEGALAGSTLTMDQALRNFVTSCGMTVPAAIAATATTPAALLGLSDRIGAIRPGFAADLVVLDSDLRVERVMKGGRWIA